MPHAAKILAICLLASLLAALPASAAPAPSDGPEATASRVCNIDRIWRKLGATYVYKLETRGVTCADAKSFSKLYHACRRRNGGKDGRCPRVRGFRCSESRYGSNPTFFSYESRVLCRRGGQRIRQRYNQQ